MFIESLGWIATAVFVGSYFCRHALTLRRVQMAGALLWVTYGALIGAVPVIAANLLVLGAAAWTGRTSGHETSGHRDIDHRDIGSADRASGYRQGTFR